MVRHDDKRVKMQKFEFCFGFLKGMHYDVSDLRLLQPCRAETCVVERPLDHQKPSSEAFACPLLTFETRVACPQRLPFPAAFALEACDDSLGKRSAETPSNKQRPVPGLPVWQMSSVLLFEFHASAEAGGQANQNLDRPGGLSYRALRRATFFSSIASTARAGCFLGALSRLFFSASIRSITGARRTSGAAATSRPCFLASIISLI